MYAQRARLLRPSADIWKTRISSSDAAHGRGFPASHPQAYGSTGLRRFPARPAVAFPAVRTGNPSAPLGSRALAWTVGPEQRLQVADRLTAWVMETAHILSSFFGKLSYHIWIFRQMSLSVVFLFLQLSYSQHTVLFAFAFWTHHLLAFPAVSVFASLQSCLTLL